MQIPKWGLGVLGVGLLSAYNMAQSDITQMRQMPFEAREPAQKRQLQLEQYGPSMQWLNRILAASSDKKQSDLNDPYTAKLDFRVMSSLMVAGLASGFKSQVANLLWMKSDEYWHKGMVTRQNPLMEMVVTLDPQFIEAWSTAGWHWAYNIYADVETNPRYKGNEKMTRQKQEQSIATGLDYLKRGSEQNPERYRLWFEHGWTRAEKAGIYDDETVALYRKAREQNDARTIERDVEVNGKRQTVKEQGVDILGRTIAHMYERVPDFDKALNQYGRDLLKGSDAELAQLDAVGRYWSLYGADYEVIVRAFNEGDATIKSRIRAIVPDVEKMVAAHAMRAKMQARNDQPTGAYITLSARYIPAWREYKAGEYQNAVNRMIGVMNSDLKFNLQGLPKLAKVMELRGDAPGAIRTRLKRLQENEKLGSQDIGLHFVAKIYETMAAKQTDPTKEKQLARLAYESWYRSRARDSLDFYAKANTRKFEDKYGFTIPQEIVDAVKASRKGGVPNAAPKIAPNIGGYYRAPQNESHDHDGDGIDDHSGEAVAPGGAPVAQ